ncbi:MAG: hypothetical protein VXZ36_05985 [Pseudomonadota bacterium]|nr:hypothetical protein [Pseudomonadota bacterium]
MPKALQTYLEEGVIYHAFSDQGGIAFYSTFSNEVLVAAVNTSTLLELLNNSQPISEQHSLLKQELCSKGFIKKEWH